MQEQSPNTRHRNVSQIKSKQAERHKKFSKTSLYHVPQTPRQEIGLRYGWFHKAYHSRNDLSIYKCLDYVKSECGHLYPTSCRRAVPALSLFLHRGYAPSAFIPHPHCVEAFLRSKVIYITLDLWLDVNIFFNLF